jgi:hypothetical protein
LRSRPDSDPTPTFRGSIFALQTTTRTTIYLATTPFSLGSGDKDRVHPCRFVRSFQLHGGRCPPSTTLVMNCSPRSELQNRSCCFICLVRLCLRIVLRALIFVSPCCRSIWKPLSGKLVITVQASRSIFLARSFLTNKTESNRTSNQFFMQLRCLPC